MAEINKITFDDLDLTLNKWISDTNEMKNIFIMQLEELNRWFFLVGDNHEQLTTINYWFNLIAFYEEQLQDAISFVTQRNIALEAAVNQMETTVPRAAAVFSNKTHPTRIQIYLNLLDVFQFITTTNENATHLSDWTESDAKCSEKDPFEQLARIMTLHLENLESIEMKIYHMLTLLQNNEYKRRLVIGRSKKIGNSITSL